MSADVLSKMHQRVVVIDSVDIEDAIGLITRKEFGTQPNSQILILANPTKVS